MSYLPWQYAYLRHLWRETDAETTNFMLDNTDWDNEKAQAFKAGFDAGKEQLLRVCEKCGGLGDDNKLHEFNKCEPCNGTGKVVESPAFVPTESQFWHGVWLNGKPGNQQP